MGSRGAHVWSTGRRGEVSRTTWLNEVFRGDLALDAQVGDVRRELMVAGGSAGALG